MKTNRLAVAALAALGIALQAAFLHAFVAAPLASAVHDAAEPRPATFEQRVVVRAVAKAPAPVVGARGS
jgi:hypothetical protein